MDSNEQIMSEIIKFQNAMEGENGKIIMQHLEKLCFQTKTTFSGNALEIAYREGMRNVYLLVKKELEIPIQEIKNKIEQEQQKGTQNVLD